MCVVSYIVLLYCCRSNSGGILYAFFPVFTPVRQSPVGPHGALRHRGTSPPSQSARFLLCGVVFCCLSPSVDAVERFETDEVWGRLCTLVDIGIVSSVYCQVGNGFHHNTGKKHRKPAHPPQNQNARIGTRTDFICPSA